MGPIVLCFCCVVAKPRVRWREASGADGKFGRSSLRCVDFVRHRIDSGGLKAFALPFKRGSVVQRPWIHRVKLGGGLNQHAVTPLAGDVLGFQL